MVYRLSRIRNKAFWALDRVKGGRIKKSFQELEEFEYMHSDSPKMKEKTDRAIEQLISHAILTTEFYRTNCSQLNFENFPIVDKNIIRSKQQEFLSNKYSEKNTIRMSTSGSTGTPFVVYQNHEKKEKVSAELIYYNNKLGYEVGENFIFLRSLNEQNKKNKISSFLQNLDLINIGNLNDESIHNILKEIEIKSKNGSTLMSYASTLDIIRDYYNKTQKNYKYKFNIKGIISGAEMLYDDTRNVMEEFFQCKCVSRYSNQENGVLGQDDYKNNEFICNEVHYLIEVFKINEDTLAEPGEIGRIVVTDFYNYAMPMIRYDTGDIGAINYVYINGVKKKVISNFTGRKIDIVYDVNGEILSPHKISVSFWGFSGIKQYQFIQVAPKKYEVILNVNSTFNEEKNVSNKLKELLGESAELQIRYVDNIPTLTSGKRKYIMNTWVE